MVSRFFFFSSPLVPSSPPSWSFSFREDTFLCNAIEGDDDDEEEDEEEYAADDVDDVDDDVDDDDAPEWWWISRIATSPSRTRRAAFISASLKVFKICIT